MHKTNIFITLGLLIITGVGFFHAPLARELWIFATFLSFAGIFLFDDEKQILSNWANIFLFLIVYGLMIKSILEPEPEYFWRDCAGVIFLIAVSFEQNGRSWFGTGGLKSSVGPAVLFFILTLASCLPILSAEQSLVCSVGAILIFCFLEVFYILRSRADAYAGSFMSAIRTASCGIISLYYSSTFLPGISANKPFTYVQVIFPLAGLLVAILGSIFEEVKKRYILFCAGWSLFIFWASLSTDPLKVYAGIGCVIAGSWAIVMTNRPRTAPMEGREIFLKLSAWGIPGSVLFSLIVLTLLHSEGELARQGSVIWLLSFFIYWAGLTGMKWEVPDREAGKERRDAGRVEKIPWSWRNSLALSVTIAGGGLLAFAQALPKFLSNFSVLTFINWFGNPK